MNNRKVFISVLGTGLYARCKYRWGNYISPVSCFVQEATLDYLHAQKWNREDAIYILVTDDAYQKNWLDNGQTDRTSGQIMKKEGLCSCLRKMNLPCNISSIKIKDGKDGNEILDNFTILFDLLHDNDRLYFDLTHGFRYLPMLVLVLGNYSKLLKNAVVKHLSYGNYEMRDSQTGTAPFVDLQSLSYLQDWTIAASGYLHEGNADRLVALSRSSLDPILRNNSYRTETAIALNKFVIKLHDVIEERRTCRGYEILTSANVRNLKKCIKEIEGQNVIRPLNPLIRKIYDSLNDFDDKENVFNGFKAAHWCFDNGLYQQACTIYYENVISYLCYLYGLLPANIKRNRFIVTDALNITFFRIRKESWKLYEENEDFRNRVTALLDEDAIIKIAPIYCSFQEVRNDFEHSGMKEKHLKYDAVKRKLADFMENMDRTIDPDRVTVQKDVYDAD